MSGKISCGKLVTGSITQDPNSASLKIGSLKWPTQTPASGTVLKTGDDGSLVFEPTNVRSALSSTDTTYDIKDTDDIVAIVGTLPTTVRLPDPTTKTPGDLIYVVKEVSGTTPVTIVPFGSELISGSTSATLTTSFGSVKLYTNGTNYFALF